MKVYLAGPEVFLSDAKAIGDAKKAICTRHGVEGLYPLDNDVKGAHEIFLANRAQMDRADAVIANMTPFRGISMDVGTAFEMGYMHARGKRVLGYSNRGGTYLDRAREAGITGPEGTKDALGLEVEDFGHVDNLMMIGAVHASGFEILVEDHNLLTGLALYSDLALFERCVERLAARR